MGARKERRELHQQHTPKLRPPYEPEAGSKPRKKGRRIDPERDRAREASLGAAYASEKQTALTECERLRLELIEAARVSEASYERLSPYLAELETPIAAKLSLTTLGRRTQTYRELLRELRPAG